MKLKRIYPWINLDARKINRRPPVRQTVPNSASGSVEDLDSLVVVEPDLFDESNLEDASTVIADSASIEVTTVENTDDQSTINRYCKCTSYECNCCREFRLPIAGIGSNGCATVNYLNGERMSVGLKFGDRLVASRVISSKYTILVFRVKVVIVLCRYSKLWMKMNACEEKVVTQV